MGNYYLEPSDGPVTSCFYVTAKRHAWRHEPTSQSAYERTLPARKNSQYPAEVAYEEPLIYWLRSNRLWIFWNDTPKFRNKCIKKQFKIKKIIEKLWKRWTRLKIWTQIHRMWLVNELDFYKLFRCGTELLKWITKALMKR